MSLESKNVANNFYVLRRFSEALEEYKRALQLNDPAELIFEASIHSNIAAVYYECGLYPQAAESCFEALEVSGGLE